MKKAKKTYDRELAICTDCGNDYLLPSKRNRKPRKYPDKCRQCVGLITSVNIKHGLGGKNRTNLYKKWVGIRLRCYSEKEKDFARYGAVGIKMIDSWKNDFLEFKKWADANGFEDNDKILRRDKFGNYSPLNCYIEKKKEEVFTYGILTMRAKEWYWHFNVQTVSYKVFRRRLLRGWDMMKAVYNGKMSNAHTVSKIEKYEPGTDRRIH